MDNPTYSIINRTEKIIVVLKGRLEGTVLLSEDQLKDKTNLYGVEVIKASTMMEALYILPSNLPETATHKAAYGDFSPLQDLIDDKTMPVSKKIRCIKLAEKLMQERITSDLEDEPLDYEGDEHLHQIKSEIETMIKEFSDSFDQKKLRRKIEGALRKNCDSSTMMDIAHKLNITYDM